MSLSEAAALVKVRRMHVAWEQQPGPRIWGSALHSIAGYMGSARGLHLPSILFSSTKASCMLLRCDPRVTSSPFTVLPLPQGAIQRKQSFRDKAVKVRVLSVDDDPVNQLVIQNLLAPVGYEILQAMDGQEALQLLAEEEQLPDVVGRWPQCVRVLSSAGLSREPVLTAQVQRVSGVCVWACGG